MRLNVSTVGTLTYSISKYLFNIVQPTLNLNETRLKNSQQFVDTAKLWEIDKNEVQVSFDVVNLYPSVPIKEAIIILVERLRNNQSFISKLTFEEIRLLLKLCLSHCYFLYENDIHELENSGPIGLALMVVVAECFLQYHESNALSLELNNNIHVKLFKRDVDDTHSMFQVEEDAQKFLDLLNKQHKSIQYTRESADLTNTLSYLMFQLPTIKPVHIVLKYIAKMQSQTFKLNRIHAMNRTHPKVINGVFIGFIHRALRLCTINNIDDELSFFIDVFVENGHTRKSL
ncbi:uncharacterized protein LOC136087099 [Hydra vulgaris]|uniref:Uncharacterized protein LOC136087099 n=1 Tax=Hydra vulgaris TaxID=6087 RepID=A0ABM4CUS0_HYDVU